MTDQPTADLQPGLRTVRRDARSVAASLTNPGCVRRQTLDAAGVNLDRLADILGIAIPPTSISAVIHGNRFEQLVVDNDASHVRRLLADTFTVNVDDADLSDLSGEATPDGQLSRAVRARATRRELVDYLNGGPPRLVRHAMTRLMVAGEWVYLEPDLLAFTADRQIVVCEVKSFPAIDGVADPRKVAHAALQMAVYVLSLRNTVGRLGGDPNLICGHGLLILPSNFTTWPAGFPVALEPAVIRLRRQIGQMRTLSADIGRLLPPHPDTGQPNPDAVQQALRQLPCRFSDACTGCPLHHSCRDEAWQQRTVDVLGGPVQETCGAVTQLDRVLALADGTARPHGPSEAALADILGRASAVAGRYGLGGR